MVNSQFGLVKTPFSEHVFSQMSQDGRCQDEQLKSLQNLLAKHGLNDFKFGNNKASGGRLKFDRNLSNLWAFH